MAVRHGLAKRDNVGRHAHLLMRPEVRACPPEAGLHLVADQQTARLAHNIGRLL